MDSNSFPNEGIIYYSQYMESRDVIGSIDIKVTSIDEIGHLYLQIESNWKNSAWLKRRYSWDNDINGTPHGASLVSKPTARFL